jgi:hypothetical protein
MGPSRCIHQGHTLHTLAYSSCAAVSLTCGSHSIHVQHSGRLSRDTDLKVVKILEQRLRHLRVLAHVRRPRCLPESRFQPRCGSRRLWTGIRKLCNTTACGDGDSLLLRSPSGGHAGVREGGGQGCGRRPVGGRRRPGGGPRGCVVHLLL